MRNLIAGLVLAAVLAGPALSQTTQLELDNLRAQQEAAQRRAVAQANEMMALEARLRAEQAAADLQTQRLLPPRAPQPPYVYSPAASAATSKLAPSYPSVPDAMLAESNRRVQAAAKPR